MDEALSKAIEALDAGDSEGLIVLLEADPELVRRKVTTTDAPYDGYFAGATLLHHVAGNPARDRELPANAPALARLLLRAGAEVDAECGGGPSQPESRGTVLGLVASSGQAAERGLSEELIDLLLEAGADPNDGCLFTALYHTVECQQQRDVATLLYERGAEVDFGYAAGLGDVDRMQTYMRDDGSFADDAYTRYRPTPIATPSRAGILLDALMFACVNGREEAVRYLLAEGADVQGAMKFGPWEVTPLHAVAWAGWPDLVPVLVDAGADLNVRDPRHQGSPPGWAAFCKREEALQRFLEYGARFDLRNAAEFGCTERFAELFGDRNPDDPVDGGAPGVLLRATAAMGHLGLVRFLLERGADPQLASSEGLTPLKFAELYGHEEIAALLRQHASGAQGA